MPQTLASGTDVTSLMPGQDVTNLMGSGVSVTPSLDDLAPKEKPKTPSKPSALGQLVSNFWDQVNPLPFITEALTHPDPVALGKDIATHLGDAVAEHYQEAKKAFDKGDYATAVNRAVAMVPFVGEGVAKAANQLRQGDYSGAAGSAMGVAANIKGPQMLHEVLPAVETAMASRAKGSAAGTAQFAADLGKAIPPKKGAPYSQEDLTRAAPYLASEHASAPITGVESLKDASDSAVTQIEAQVEKYIGLHPQDLIRTDPLGAAREALKRGVRASDVAKGMAELDDLGLDQPVTVRQADLIRRRLNAENDAIMSKNSYDRANARAADPGFVAREAAVKALRDGVYNQLEERGISGVRQLRQDEGALMSLRDAAQYHIYNGEASVPGTGMNSPAAKIARKVIPPAAAVLGEHFGGPMGAVGAAGGAVLADQALSSMLPPNLTRDALVGRAFKNLKVPAPNYPFIPQEPEIRGLLTPPPIVGARAPVSPTDRLVPSRTVEMPDTSGTGGLVPGFFQPTQKRLPEPVSPPIVTPLPPDVSGTGQSFTGFYQPTQKRLPGAPVTEAVPSAPSVQGVPGRPGFTAGVPDRSGAVDVPMQSYVVRDPKTGRFKRVYFYNRLEGQ